MNTKLVFSLLFAASLSAVAGLASAQSTSAPSGATAAVRDTMAQRMQACVMCHGQEGRATSTGYFPRIAGKPEGYLFNQLKNFREGRRRNQAMRHLTQHMSDDFLRDIARNFSALDLPYPPAPAHGLSAWQQQTAEQLVFKGVPERQIPACASCHGSSMAGRLPAMPGLLTLPADYLIGQLGAWRTGLRAAAAPDCMADIAKRLTNQEVSAVARWLSAQSLPTGTKPETVSAQPLPVDCGSGTE
ncbi:MAG: c-type cytochrome [Rubrivivax sp.]